MRYLIVCLLSIASLSPAMATHLMGGEITWECTPSGQYIFTMVVYRECGQGAVPLQPNQTISSQAATIPVSRISVTEISPTCLGGGSISCNSSPSCVGAVERHIFKSGVITLTGTPPVGGWTFSWYNCCRPGCVVNLVNPGSTGYYLRAKMYPYTPVGATAANNVNPCFDNSPYFEELGSLTICSGSEFVYNHLAADKDLDSLYIDFASPLGTTTGGPVTWAANYGNRNPYPNPSTDPANGPITINNRTGEVTMNIQNASPGSYPSCYVVEAWKCGQTPSGPAPVKVAEVFRDVAIIVRNNCPANNEPNLLIDTSLYTDIRQHSSKFYSTRVYPGDTIAFNMSASDWDFLPNGSPQRIFFNAAGLQASKPMGSGTGCNGVAPCATFDPVSPQNSYNSQLNNNISFFWVPDCQHLNVDGNYCSPFNTFTFSLRMEDNACPAPEISLTTFLVEVIIGDPSPINIACLSTLNSGDLDLQWQRSQQDSALEFNYYSILGAAPGGTFDTIQRVYDIDSTSLVIPGSSGYTDFYIVKSTGKCDFFSKPSDTLSVINMSLTATPPGSAEYAQLSWTALSDPLLWTTRGVYEIWAEAPAGSGNWVVVGETTDLSYTDTVTVCNSLVNYQIRVTDTLVGCQSRSNIESARFSDQTNSDKMVIDSVSVNTDGNAIISFQPTKYGDVVAYYLFYRDPKLGWTVVDTIPRNAPMPVEWTGSAADVRSEQFKVVSVDSCMNQSDDQVVRPHTSIYLNAYLNKCEGFTRLSWNAYEGFGKDAIAGYNLYVQTTDPNGTTNPKSLLYTASAEDTSYVQNNLQNGFTYCYIVQVVDTSGALTSSSNEQCFEAEVPAKSKILHLAQATYEPDGGAINLSTFVDGNADVESFSFERAPDIEGPYQKIGTVAKPSTAPYIINFSDFGALATRYRYFYRVSATDSCGGRDTLSNYARNILLEVEPRANLTNLLTWNEYAQWDGEVGTYSVYRQAGDETGFYKVAEVTGTDTFYVDDISDYGNSDGRFCYHVVAQELNNSLGIIAPNGLPYTSRSNDVCLNQWARVYMPTAFRPGSDIGQNRSFGPTLKFEDVTQYSFYIMNRWGVKVFETSDPTMQWDGTHDGEEVSAGVYVYFLEYATPGDQTKEQRGTFTLIR